MNREKCRDEMSKALFFGNVITILIFALTHTIFEDAVEVLAYWSATWFVSTYVVWSGMDWIKKCRDAWRSNHGRH